SSRGAEPRVLCFANRSMMSIALTGLELLNRGRIRLRSKSAIAKRKNTRPIRLNLLHRADALVRFALRERDRRGDSRALLAPVACKLRVVKRYRFQLAVGEGRLKDGLNCRREPTVKSK